ncbi:hypothetical protein G6011_05948 [Alternaria panax]|uniref:EngB-type G domain-containing protein n=1 Tax=Alternaria panax TaxID=48097 RepID=A0AAD4FGQ8_9PLEO|nr:hypothetical protein G6011_05948 [Alternaria panax]
MAAVELGPTVNSICATHYPLTLRVQNGMNNLPPSSRYSTDTASQDDAPNARLRLHKHWNGDARAKFRMTPPTKNTLHMSKTRSNFHLELTAEQKPSVPIQEPRQVSMRERRMRRRAGIPGSWNVASVENSHLAPRVGQEIPGQMGNTQAKEEDATGDALSQLEAQVPGQDKQQPRVQLGSVLSGEDALSQLEAQLASQPSSRKKRKGKKGKDRDLEPELIPSPPSPPLGTKPKPQASMPEIPSTAESLAQNKLQGFNWYWDTFPPTIAQKTIANTFFISHGRAAKLLRSVAQFRLFPESDVPEVAFVGRSNVGKSSLLNAVMGADIKALLARTSSTPGFTKTMNLYGVGAGNGVTIKKMPNGREKIVGIGGMTIVDMPGYGEGSLASWGTEIMKYITSRKQLRRVFILVDAEHGIKDKDRSLLASLRLAGVSHQVILSKLDKLYIPDAKEIRRHDGKSIKKLAPKGTTEELRKVMEKLKADIQPPVGGGALGEILGFSAETLVDGKRLGVDHVRFAVLKAVGLDGKYKKESSIDQNTLSWR